FAFWLILSGKLEMNYLVFGVISAILVTFLTQDLLPPARRRQADFRARWRGRWKSSSRFLAYLAWLVTNIFEANLQVAYLVLHPKLPIEPGLLRFTTTLQSEIGHVILANSITLTPGTITVHYSEGTYLVHTLVPQAATSLLEARMQNKLQRIFGEVEESQPDIRWIGENL
ncbi:MAG TPA: Na+/H+ antiporter subunit E, partial [Terriglobales bacterium]|nr:Na+/H+ antiporter subunit E [Terriglobales bacterium]